VQNHVVKRDVAEGATALSVACFAALFGLDTRLGVYCFGICPETRTVTLNLNLLLLAVQACNRSEQQRCLQDCTQLRRERGLEGHVLPLSPRDLCNIRDCAERHYLEVLSQGRSPKAGATPKCREVFQKIRDAPAELVGQWNGSSDLQWAKTLLRDSEGATRSLPAVLSAIFGVAVEAPLLRHVRLGLVPTAQRLRSHREYAEDFSKVNSAVEEREFFVGHAPVPRPPEP
jgi:hypothetical protein